MRLLEDLGKWPAQALKRRAPLLLALVALVLCPALLGIAETPLDEYRLKAAFIYNFVKFVEWPESAFRQKGEFCIGTLGRTPLDQELAKLRDKTVAGRKVVVRQLNSVDDAVQCQVLFVSRGEMNRFERSQGSIRHLPVLTVSDKEDFCHRGGMIGLERESERLVFVVNLQEMQRARLKPHSQLLKLARRIYGRP